MRLRKLTKNFLSLIVNFQISKQFANSLKRLIQFLFIAKNFREVKEHLFYKVKILSNGKMVEKKLFKISELVHK
jgi:hypothetical protein